MKLIYRFFRQSICLFPKLFAVAMLFVFALTAMDTLVPWALRLFLERLTEENSYLVLVVGASIFAIFLLVKVFVRIQWYISLDRFGGKYINALSLLIEQSMTGTYYSEIENISPAVARNILFSDILNVFRVIGHHIPSIVGAVTIILACISVSAMYNLKITVFILVAAVCGFLISWFSRKILAKSAGSTNAKLKVHDSWCSQFVEMLPLIQNHNILDYYQEKTSSNLEEFITASIEEDKKSLFWSGIANSYHSLISVMLSAFLAIPIAGNSIPDLVFFTMIAELIMEQTQKVEMLFQQVMKMYISFEHVDKLYNLPQRTGSETLHKIETIDFASVNFSYANGTGALKNVSCNLKTGDIIRLAGANGSGKSTFVKLLTGLYHSTEGDILVNGKPLDSYSKASINKQILHIDQDELCLNELYKKYIEIISSKDIADFQYADLLSSVNLIDEGRVIERNGKALSVGQRKKLLAMKFLLSNNSASVIVLDELTAGLDAETTQKVYSFINEVAERKNKIIIIVDHNMTDDALFSKIFHFKDGSITVS